MFTMWKLMALVFAGALVIPAYISSRQPMTNADGWFIIASAFIILWLGIQIWRIDDLKDELAKSRQETADMKYFIGIIGDPVRVKDVLVEKAQRLQKLFETSLKLQQEHQDEVPEELVRVQALIEEQKSDFWRAVQFAFLFVGVPPVRSYKNYLSTSSWQSGIPAEKA